MIERYYLKINIPFAEVEFLLQIIVRPLLLVGIISPKELPLTLLLHRLGNGEFTQNIRRLKYLDLGTKFNF